MDATRLDNSKPATSGGLEYRLHSFPLAPESFESARIRFSYRRFRLRTNVLDYKIGDLMLFFDAADHARHFFARVDEIRNGEVCCAAVADFDILPN